MLTTGEAPFPAPPQAVITAAAAIAIKNLLFIILIRLLFIVLGFVAVVVVGAIKLVAIGKGVPAPLVTSSPYFYIALTMMILGTQLFVAGFLGELISRNATERNNYKIEKEI